MAYFKVINVRVGVIPEKTVFLKQKARGAASVDRDASLGKNPVTYSTTVINGRVGVIPEKTAFKQPLR